MEERLIKVGITHGDINGIGYEVILKTFSDTRMAELCTPIIYGSSKIAAYHRKALELPPINMNIISHAEDAGVNRVNIINCVEDETKVELSKSTPVAGESAFKALEAAVTDMKRGVVDVLLTAPINKHNIQNEDFHFPGHTEYLEKCFGGLDKKALMILMKDDLRVALVTGHIPLSQVASSLNVGDIVNKLRIFNQSLKQDFGIVKPRIAVLSLNPHAGDAGLLGTEEETIIIPAMQEAEKKGVMSFGPYAADGFFGSQVYDKFDGVLLCIMIRAWLRLKRWRWMTVLIIRRVYQSYGLHRLMVRLMILPARMWPLKNLSVRPYMLHWIFTGIVSVIVRQQPTLCASSISIKEVTMKSST